MVTMSDPIGTWTLERFDLEIGGEVGRPWGFDRSGIRVSECLIQ